MELLVASSESGAVERAPLATAQVTVKEEAFKQCAWNFPFLLTLSHVPPGIVCRHTCRTRFGAYLRAGFSWHEACRGNPASIVAFSSDGGRPATVHVGWWRVPPSRNLRLIAKCQNDAISNA